MVTVPASTTLYQALQEEDFPIPEHCSNIEIKMPCDGCFEVVYTCIMTDEDVATYGRALVRVGSKTP